MLNTLTSSLKYDYIAFEKAVNDSKDINMEVYTICLTLSLFCSTYLRGIHRFLPLCFIYFISYIIIYIYKYIYIFRERKTGRNVDRQTKKEIEFEGDVEEIAVITIYSKDK